MTFLQMPLEDKIERIPWSGCWIWMGGLNGDGYGNYKDSEGTQHRAHRLVWTILRGSIPLGLFVLHKCDIRCCVNPEHLYIGDQVDNIGDALARDRIQGRNRGITHCHRGHEFTSENTRVETTGSRRCRTCARLR